MSTGFRMSVESISLCGLWQHADFRHMLAAESVSLVGSVITLLAISLLAVTQLDASAASGSGSGWIGAVLGLRIAIMLCSLSVPVSLFWAQFFPRRQLHGPRLVT